MRILMVTPRIPHPIRGRRAYDLARWLPRRHDVDLLTFAGVERAEPAAALAGIRAQFGRVEVVRLRRPWAAVSALAHVAGATPLRVNFFRSHAMAAALGRLARERDYDIVYVKRVQMAQFAPPELHPGLVLDLTDCLSLYYRTLLENPVSPWRRRLGEHEWRRLRRYEARLLRDYPNVVVCGSADAAELGRLEPGLPPAAVIPNGLDTECFAPRAEAVAAQQMVLVGYMGGETNLDAARYLIEAILPRVRRQIPTASATIVGADPPAWLMRLARGAGVSLTGHVSDTRPYMARAGVVVAPVRSGAGIKNKVLEPMSMARPVVALETACTGLGLSSGEQLLLADDADPFAQHVVAVMQTPERYAAMGRRARAWVEGHFGREATLDRFDQLFARIGAQRQNASIRLVA